MNTARRALAGLFVIGFVGVLSGQATAPAQSPATLASPAPVTSPVLSPEEMEAFLLNAKIVDKKRSSKGVTDTVRATLSDGRLTHDAQIQTVDLAQMIFNAGKASEVNFKDTYRFNIGGYRLARLLGLSNVPMSVKRVVDGKPAAMTWWIDDYQFDEGGRLKLKNGKDGKNAKNGTSVLGPDPERTSKQIHVLRVWDELIQNRDRNQGNYVWTNDWTLWMIDHTRAFRLGKTLLKPDQLTRCDRSLLDAMRALTLERLTEAMGDILQKDEIAAVLIRRDALVKLFEERIATRGEAAVLFSM